MERNLAKLEKKKKNELKAALGKKNQRQRLSRIVVKTEFLADSEEKRKKLIKKKGKRGSSELIAQFWRLNGSFGATFNPFLKIS